MSQDPQWPDDHAGASSAGESVTFELTQGCERGREKKSCRCAMIVSRNSVRTADIKCSIAGVVEWQE